MKKKILIFLLIMAVCVTVFSILRPIAIQERGNTAFGGEILFITVVPLIAYPAWKTVKDTFLDFVKRCWISQND